MDFFIQLQPELNSPGKTMTGYWFGVVGFIILPNLSCVSEINNTIAAVPLFFFSVTYLFICYQPAYSY